MIHQLPIGKIFYLKNESEKTSKILLFAQLRDKIPEMWRKLVNFLESRNIRYIISPILPLSVYHSSIFPELFKISRTPLEFKFKKNSIIELPLFPLRMRLETFTFNEQACLFQVLKEKYPTGQTNFTHSRWKDILRGLKDLKEKSLISYESVRKIIG